MLRKVLNEFMNCLIHSLLVLILEKYFKVLNKKLRKVWLKIWLKRGLNLFKLNKQKVFYKQEIWINFCLIKSKTNKKR